MVLSYLRKLKQKLKQKISKRKTTDPYSGQMDHIFDHYGTKHFGKGRKTRKTRKTRKIKKSIRKHRTRKTRK